MKNRRKMTPQGKILRTLFLLLTAAVTLFLCDRSVGPYLEGVVEAQAKNYALLTITEAVEDTLSEKKWKYGDFVSLQYDEGNKISALTVDSQAVNRFQASVARQITENLQNGKRIKRSIAVGTLLGNDWMRERGFRLPFYFSLYGEVTCELQHGFDDAGINQTRHSLQVEITCGISAQVPGVAGKKFFQTSQILVAETVIVGEVPENYWVAASGMVPILDGKTGINFSG